MKNLVFAALGLVIVITIIFIFASKQEGKKDTLIPEQKQIASPKLDVFGKQNESSGSSMKKQYTHTPPILAPEQIKNKKVRIKTDKGDVVIMLFETSPIASSNFLFLTEEHFYDGLTFHRREENFVIQGGDPNGNGSGGPGYQFADEVVTLDYKRGIVAMANAGPNTNGSQFFIMLADVPSLPKNYTIFGEVVAGMEVVDKIAVGDIMKNVLVEN